jgi:hypothetical protein
MASRLVRSFALDSPVSTDLDIEAERNGVSKSEMVNQLLAEALMVRRAVETRRAAATGLTYAGLGTASLTALLALAILLLA